MHAELTKALSEVLGDLIRDLRCAVSALPAPVLRAPVAGILTALSIDGELRLSCLARKLGVDMSTASRHASSAIKKGFVGRRPDPDDGRAGLLHLTDAGEAALAEHRRVLSAWLSSIGTSWTDDEARRLIADLTRLRQEITAGTPGARTLRDEADRCKSRSAGAPAST